MISTLNTQHATLYTLIFFMLCAMFTRRSLGVGRRLALPVLRSRRNCVGGCLPAEVRLLNVGGRFA